MKPEHPRRVGPHSRVRIEWAGGIDLSALFQPRSLGAITLVAAMCGGAAYAAAKSNGILFALLVALVGAAAGAAVAAALVIALPGAVARGFATVVTASGGSTPMPEDWSLEKSLLARGEVEKALELLRARLDAEPKNVALRLFVADVYAREAGEPRTAEALYLIARDLPRATDADDYRATNRLVDLYLGPLDDATRAAVELRRLRDRHPHTSGGRHAEAALQQLPTRARLESA